MSNKNVEKHNDLLILEFAMKNKPFFKNLLNLSLWLKKQPTRDRKGDRWGGGGSPLASCFTVSWASKKIIVIIIKMILNNPLCCG